MGTVHSFANARDRREAVAVDLQADILALAYLYNYGEITIGPGHPHQPEIVRALVQRLHAIGLVIGDPRARTLRITEPGRRAVRQEATRIAELLDMPARRRVIEARHWIGAPRQAIDTQLEQHRLVTRTGSTGISEPNANDLVWTTPLLAAVAEILATPKAEPT